MLLTLCVQVSVFSVAQLNFMPRVGKSIEEIILLRRVESEEKNVRLPLSKLRNSNVSRSAPRDRVHSSQSRRINTAPNVNQRTESEVIMELMEHTKVLQNRIKVRYHPTHSSSYLKYVRRALGVGSEINFDRK